MGGRGWWGWQASQSDRSKKEGLAQGAACSLDSRDTELFLQSVVEVRGLRWRWRLERGGGLAAWHCSGKGGRLERRAGDSLLQSAGVLGAGGEGARNASGAGP